MKQSLPIAPTFTIQDLKNLPELWYKIHVLIFDLRSYQTNTGSRDRLETVIGPSYIRSPYFTSCEVAIIKSLQIGGSKGPTMLAELIDEFLQVRLEWRMKK
jgi:hypothetical protein